MRDDAVELIIILLLPLPQNFIENQNKKRMNSIIHMMKDCNPIPNKNPVMNLNALFESR